MEYIIENEYLKVTVTTSGAQIKSVIRKCDGAEHMWQADPDVWGNSAPILFPHCGRLLDGKFIAKGETYETNLAHGFARLMEHIFVYQNKDMLVLQLTDTPETLALWPYKFRLMSAFTIEGDVLHHTLTVENRDEEEMPFGIGYHPGFAIPFDDKHTFADYEFRFDIPQSPLCLNHQPSGLFQGNTYYLAYNTDTIAIDENLFANDSHCMAGLTAKTLGIYEKDTGRAVVCDIADFPYTLIWSKPGEPKFVCIEPWQSIPSAENSDHKWENKPAAAIIEPGESWSTTLSMTFQR